MARAHWQSGMPQEAFGDIHLTPELSIPLAAPPTWYAACGVWFCVRAEDGTSFLLKGGTEFTFTERD